MANLSEPQVKDTPTTPSAVELLQKFIEENNINLIVEPPVVQLLPDGNFLIGKPNVVVKFKSSIPEKKN